MENVKEKPGQRPGWVGWRVVRPEGKGGGNGCVSTVHPGHKIFQNRKVGSKSILDGILYQLSTTTILDVVYHKITLHIIL